MLNDKFKIRDMRTKDLVDVVKIEQRAQAAPWSRLSFEESLTNLNRCRLIEASESAEKNSANSVLSTQILAYSITSSVLDDIHILNVVCAPYVRGQGLGHVLMSDIFDYAKQTNAENIFLEVRASNLIAQRLYEKWGFNQISIRKRYYRASSETEGREDAYVYCRKL